MKKQYRIMWMILCLLSYSMMSQAGDSQDQLIDGIDRNNKAKILGCIKQDPSLLFSLIKNENFLNKPDKIIHTFTTLKKAGVNLNYQDDGGSSILHVLGQSFINDFSSQLAQELLSDWGVLLCFRNLNCKKAGDFFETGLVLSDPDMVVYIKNNQKFVKELIKLGVNKKLKDRESLTAAEGFKKFFIDEIESYRTRYKLVFNELDKLYKMLK